MNEYEKLLNFFSENNVSLDYNQVQKLYEIADRYSDNNVALNEGLLDKLKNKFFKQKKKPKPVVKKEKSKEAIEKDRKIVHGVFSEANRLLDTIDTKGAIGIFDPYNPDDAASMDEECDGFINGHDVNFAVAVCDFNTFEYDGPKVTIRNYKNSPIYKEYEAICEKYYNALNNAVKKYDGYIQYDSDDWDEGYLSFWINF